MTDEGSTGTPTEDTEATAFPAPRKGRCGDSGRRNRKSGAKLHLPARPRRRRRGDEQKPTALDLFHGPGGLTLGLKRAGFRVIGAIELDPLAVETYRKNHPEVTVWEGDIRKVHATEVMRTLGLRPGELGLLAGCSPCEGYSALRTLNGAVEVEDDRNELIGEFIRFVRLLKPKAVMLENVPALASDRRLALLKIQLERAGYRCTVEVLDAADYGVPQRRKRMILLAGRGGEIDVATKAKRRRTVRSAIKRLKPVGESNDPLHDLPEKRSQQVMDRIKRIPKDGGSRTALAAEEQLECHKRCNGFKDIYGRMAWKDVAPTLTAGCVNPSKGRFLHPEEDRAITLREAALLQTFPPKYYFSLARGKHRAAEMIGNALPPEFIRRQAVKVREFIRSRFSQVREFVSAAQAVNRVPAAAQAA